MANIQKTLSKRSPEHSIRIPVVLPGYYQRGVYHGEIVLTAKVDGGTLAVDLQVYGEGTQCPGLYRGTFTAADLGVSSGRRTADFVGKGTPCTTSD